MEIGVITDYDSSKATGNIDSVTGEVVTFSYSDGQNMKYGDDLVTPRLTGEHEQPSGYSLKKPQIGDPVIYERTGNRVKVWGYARVFVDLVERKHGAHFIN